MVVVCTELRTTEANSGMTPGAEPYNMCMTVTGNGTAGALGGRLGCPAVLIVQ